MIYSAITLRLVHSMISSGVGLAYYYQVMAITELGNVRTYAWVNGKTVN